jgi:hypothetical protein
MFVPEFSNQFKRSYKLMMKRGENPKLLEKAMRPSETLNAVLAKLN